MYNTLGTNVITSNVTPATSNTAIESLHKMENSLTYYSLLLNNLLKSPNLTNGSLNPSYYSPLFHHNNLYSSSTIGKDVTLNNIDSEILHIDNLETLTTLSNNLTSSTTLLNFYNVNLYTNDLENTNLTFNSKPAPKTINVILGHLT